MVKNLNKWQKILKLFIMMGAVKNQLEDGINRRLNGRLFLHKSLLLGLILLIVVGAIYVIILLTGLLTNADSMTITRGASFHVSYEKTSDSMSDHFPNTVVDSIKQLFVNAMAYVGLTNMHKSRRKRDLEQENRLQMINYNQLDKDEDSIESDSGDENKNLGFEDVFKEMLKDHSMLQIIYTSNGKDLRAHNDIARSMRRRRKRNIPVDTLSHDVTEYKTLETEYTRCKKEELNVKECDKILEKLKSIADLMSENFVEISNMIHDFKHKKSDYSFAELIDNLSKKEVKYSNAKLLDHIESIDAQTKQKDNPNLPIYSTTYKPLTKPGTISLPTQMPSTVLSPTMTVTADPFEAYNSHENILDDIHDRKGSHIWSSDPIVHSTAQTITVTTKTTSAFTNKKFDVSKTTHHPTIKPVVYNPENHRPIVKDCVHDLDDLLASVDLGPNIKSRNCTKSHTTPQQQQHTTRESVQHRNVPDEPIDDLYTHFGQPAHPIHEELSDHTSEPKDMHDFIMNRSRNRLHYSHDYMDHHFPTTVESMDARSTKQMSPVAASGPFLNLCQQLRNQNSQGPIKTTISNHHNFQAQQFGGIGQTGFPVSGETSHVRFTSAYGGYPPSHFCFYQVPHPSGVVNRPVYGHQEGPPESIPLHLLNDPNITTIIVPRTDPRGFGNIPVNYHKLPGRRDGGATDTEAENQKNIQLICSIVQKGALSDSYSWPMGSVTEPITTGHQAKPIVAPPIIETSSNETEELDRFRVRTNRRGHCNRGWSACASGHQCVRNTQWCNRKTDCLDGSDESHCPCPTRLHPKRICDGYRDCPLGEDEMGCFGCDKFSFSCFNSVYEFESASKAGATCFTTIEKCDGFDNCFNHKDEQDCTMLVKDLGNVKAFSVGHSSGVLHRNHKGKWYPVCRNPIALARQACEAEIGPLDHEPSIERMQGHLPGPFIQGKSSSQHVFQPHFTDTCNGEFNYVRCPQPKCGTTKLNEFPSARIKIRSKRNTTDEIVKSVRIVGGSDAEPGAYPFIVAIFRDGKFHCGGSIYNEHWIISAAHCCDNYHKHYFELRAGMLRKRSFAAQVQIAIITQIIVHHGYSAQTMANDISLMRTDRVLHWNRWVRPICLPDRHRTTGDRDWLWGPKAGSLCTSIGWGALWERGRAPDHLKHVTVPILGYCKHKNDRDGMYICASDPEGGHDACQGDSGGPFVCPSSSNPNEWYLAGVVSHGEGCARRNEPGVYTRIALYLEWIKNKVEESPSDMTPLMACPGFQCPWGTTICLPSSRRCNGEVHCLGGEDEANCPLDNLLGSVMNRTENTTTSNLETTTIAAKVSSVSGHIDGTSTPLPLMTNLNDTISAASNKTTRIIVTTAESPPHTLTLGFRNYSTSTSNPTTSTGKPVTFTVSTTPCPSETTTVQTTTSSTTTLTYSSMHASQINVMKQELETTSELPRIEEILSTVTRQELETTSELPRIQEILSTVTQQDLATTPELPRIQEHETQTQSFRALNETQDVLKTSTIIPLEETAVISNATDHKNVTEMQQVASEITRAVATANEHPFFRNLVDLHDEKYKRLNMFHLSAHNLHTSLQNISDIAINETYRYKRFSCNKIRQSINIAHRCDRIIDCEDGSDEVGCTCRDYLQDKYNFLICDGKTDCWDLTDEKDCFKCEPGTHACRMSKKCIHENQICDSHPDCPLHEDELDCVALTDGYKVYYDANNLSLFRYDGLVTKNKNGSWHLVCGVEIDNQTAAFAGKICSFLGFAGHKNYSQYILQPHVNMSSDLSGALLELVRSHRNISAEADCKALHVSCVPYINATEHEISHFENQHKEIPVQVNIKPINPIKKPQNQDHITFHENEHIEFIENFGDDYDWPWNVDIYLEGEFLCSAIIVDVSWVIVESSNMRLIGLKNDYLSIVAGGAKSYLKITGPYEQVVRVDCYHFIPDARVVMLHLEKQLTFTRHVLPTFIPEKDSKIEDNQCLAVAQDKLGRTRTLRVHIDTTNCTSDKYICYQRDREHNYHAEHCYSEAAIRSGVVVCKTTLSGWYPVGFYQHKRGLCGFDEIVRMISLKEYFHDIQHVLGHRKCDYQFPAPHCEGKRCRYGKCVDHSLVCDRKLDCNDGSDEREDWCADKNGTTACLPTHFRCQNGHCVEKSKFCDGRNDCGDLSDEPHECSCYTYIKVTEPSKICDGIRNCWDKSDENPRLCKCRESRFRCGDTNTCVAQDFVCDGEVDCPGGEDERYCYALQQNTAETNFGEVMQQTFGIWHSKCFPKNVKYDDQQIKQICESVGYHRVPKVYGRKMIQESRLRTANSTDHPVDRLRKTATKAVVQNKFSRVKINEKQSFFMKPSRPMFRLVNWNEEDERNCDRLEINCGN